MREKSKKKSKLWVMLLAFMLFIVGVVALQSKPSDLREIMLWTSFLGMALIASGQTLRILQKNKKR